MTDLMAKAITEMFSSKPEDAVKISDGWDRVLCPHVPELSLVDVYFNGSKGIETQVTEIELRMYGFANIRVGRIGECPRCGIVYYSELKGEPNAYYNPER